MSSLRPGLLSIMTNPSAPQFEEDKNKGINTTADNSAELTNTLHWLRHVWLYVLVLLCCDFFIVSAHYSGQVVKVTAEQFQISGIHSLMLLIVENFWFFCALLFGYLHSVCRHHAYAACNGVFFRVTLAGGLVFCLFYLFYSGAELVTAAELFTDHLQYYLFEASREKLFLIHIVALSFFLSLQFSSAQFRYSLILLSSLILGFQLDQLYSVNPLITAACFLTTAHLSAQAVSYTRYFFVALFINLVFWPFLLG